MSQTGDLNTIFNLFKYEVTSRWLAIIGWGIGLTLFSAIYIGVYPEMAGELEGLANLSIYRAFGIDLASFAGFIASVVVQIIPIILGVYVILLSTGTLAGEEDTGTLELVVAMPLQRWQIVAMKAAALALVLLLIMVLFGAGSALILALVSQTLEVDVTPWQLFVALLGTYPLMLAIFAIGLFLGTIMPNRRMALVLLAVIYIGSYMLNTISGLAESLEPLARVSLFGYVDTSAAVFTEGLAASNLLVLFGIAGLFLLLAIVGFQRRNITVGQWIWQRGSVPAR